VPGPGHLKWRRLSTGYTLCRLAGQMPLIALEQISKDYGAGETRVTALHDVNLTIDAGEFVAIWGPSGSGKSTLCNLIGLLDSATSGTVRLDGQDVASLADNRRSELRNRTIDFIFQSFNLIPVLSALENVMLPLHIQGEDTVQARQKARQRLSDLGLAAYMGRRPHKLSGGQQQRVAIARALITDSRVVVADEPTANLDSDTALTIIDLMRQLNQQSGTTFLFSTHDQRLLARVSRRVLLRDGMITEDITATAS
jgi:putative ABC transport system ATP-binding protein